jgi:hypothetical protein
MKSIFKLLCFCLFLTVSAFAALADDAPLTLPVGSIAEKRADGISRVSRGSMYLSGDAIVNDKKSVVERWCEPNGYVSIDDILKDLSSRKQDFEFDVLDTSAPLRIRCYLYVENYQVLFEGSAPAYLVKDGDHYAVEWDKFELVMSGTTTFFLGEDVASAYIVSPEGIWTSLEVWYGNVYFLNRYAGLDGWSLVLQYSTEDDWHDVWYDLLTGDQRPTYHVIGDHVPVTLPDHPTFTDAKLGSGKTFQVILNGSIDEGRAAPVATIVLTKERSLQVAIRITQNGEVIPKSDRPAAGVMYRIDVHADEEFVFDLKDLKDGEFSGKKTFPPGIYTFYPGSHLWDQSEPDEGEWIEYDTSYDGVTTTVTQVTPSPSVGEF